MFFVGVSDNCSQTRLLESEDGGSLSVWDVDNQFTCRDGIKSRGFQSWYFESQTNCEVIIYNYAGWGFRNAAANL